MPANELKMKKCLFFFLALIGTIVLYVFSASDNAAKREGALQAELAQEGTVNKQLSDSSNSDTTQSLFPVSREK